jgi:hypothetical protein
MADDGMTAERQALLDDVEELNELLARMSVATRLPYSQALRMTTAELGPQVRVLRRDYQTKRQQLDGLV